MQKRNTVLQQEKRASMIDKENIHFCKEITIKRITEIEVDGKNQIA